MLRKQLRKKRRFRCTRQTAKLDIFCAACNARNDEAPRATWRFSFWHKILLFNYLFSNDFSHQKQLRPCQADNVVTSIKINDEKFFFYFTIHIWVHKQNANWKSRKGCDKQLVWFRGIAKKSNNKVRWCVRRKHPPVQWFIDSNFLLFLADLLTQFSQLFSFHRKCVSSRKPWRIWALA